MARRRNTAKAPELKVDPDEAQVTVDGNSISYVKMEYWMLHKPAGVVSATEDRRDRTVLDLLSGAARKDLFPVGRLDKDTEGLLLITNDGALSHRLLSPKSHVSKVYEAVIDGKVTEERSAGICRRARHWGRQTDTSGRAYHSGNDRKRAWHF